MLQNYKNKELFDNDDINCINSIKQKTMFKDGNLRAMKYTLLGVNTYSMNTTNIMRDTCMNGNYKMMEYMCNYCISKFGTEWKKMISESKVGFIAKSIMDSSNYVPFNNILMMYHIYCTYFGYTMEQLLSQLYEYTFSGMDYSTCDGLLTVLQLYENYKYNIINLIKKNSKYIFSKKNTMIFINDIEKFPKLFEKVCNITNIFLNNIDAIREHIFKYGSVRMFFIIKNLFVTHYNFNIENDIFGINNELFKQSIKNAIIGNNEEMLIFCLKNKKVTQEFILNVFIHYNLCTSINCIYISKKYNRKSTSNDIIKVLLDYVDGELDPYKRDFTKAYNDLIIIMHEENDPTNAHYHDAIWDFHYENGNGISTKTQFMNILIDALLSIIKWNNYCINNNYDFYFVTGFKELISKIFCVLIRADGTSRYIENIIYLMKYFNVPIQRVHLNCTCNNIFLDTIEYVNI